MQEDQTQRPELIFVSLCAALSVCAAGPRASAKGQPRLRWALAGRDPKKVQSVKASLQLDSSAAEEPAIIVADSNDIQSLQRMTAQTRVVISTVGPYAKYGESLIAACCKTGTSYCDLTGESAWAELMITKYGDAAAKAGALIVNMTGFDSIPADICAFMAADWLKTQRQTNTMHLQGYTEVKGGGVSGGTIASMLYMKSVARTVQSA